MALLPSSSYTPQAKFNKSGKVKQTVLNLRDYGAACDGGCSQSGIFDSGGVITDATPSTLLPLANQTLTWIGRSAAVGGGITNVTMASSGAAPVITTNSAHGLSTNQIVSISGIVGLIAQPAVVAASTVNVSISSPGTAVFDGVTLSALDTVLLKDQSTASQNGVYIFHGSSSAMIRLYTSATDYILPNLSTSIAIYSQWIPVTAGTLYGGTSFVNTNSGNIIINTTSITYAQYGGTTPSPGYTGLTGSPELNGDWLITKLSSTTFSVPLNIASIGSYLSGGTVKPQLLVNGFVYNPQVIAGTLTLTVGISPSDHTPVPLPSGANSTGSYYYGTDDTTAWQTAITDAATLSSTSQVTTITWVGTSMVSQPLVIASNTLLLGQWRDYVNPNGTDALSSYPQRGSILRAIGTFANRTTSTLLQLGSGSSLKSGSVSASCMNVVVDAANVARIALNTAGQRNWCIYTYALNGLFRAFALTGGNAVCYECIAGQSNTGDALYTKSSDTKWHGGYIRQATNGIHVNGGDAIYIGGGTHIFSGFNAANEQFGTDILVDAATTHLVVDGVIFDGTLGPQIRFAPQTNASIDDTIIANVTAFQPENTMNQYPFCQLDTSTSNSSILAFQLQNYAIKGGATHYTSLMDLKGAGTQSKIILGSGTGRSVDAIYTTDGVANRPASISGQIAVDNFSTNTYSSVSGVWTATGNGTTRQFPLAHSLNTAPHDIEFGPANRGSVGVQMIGNSSQLLFNFPTAPANGVALEAWYKASI